MERQLQSCWFLCTVCRSQAALDDFREGLNVVGLLPHMVAMPEAFKPLFCTAPQPLTRSQLRNLFVVQWSEVGTNFREQEEDTVYAWEQFLLAIEGMTSLFC